MSLPTSTRRPTVSVVLSTFQRSALLARSLEALAAQTHPREDWELVVIDNGSTDTTSDVLASAAEVFGPRLVVLRNEVNTSAPDARNRAIAAASGSIVAFTDDDCRPTPGWLYHLVEAFDDPDVVLAQGRTVPDPDQPLTPTSRSQWTLREHGLYETCNIAYRRDALDRAGDGPFATDLPDRMRDLLGERVAALAFGEDVDLGWRVLRSGGRSRFVRDAEVHHHVFESDVGYLLRRSLQVAGFPMLVRAYPELRGTFLYRRLFLSRRHALGVGLLVALASRVRPAVAVAAGAYAWDVVRPRAPGVRRRVRGAPLRVARDLIETGALIYGSARTRSVVL